MCVGCKNIKYCSVECQQTDWPSHKLLCKTFQDFAERPSPDVRRVIVFPPNEKTPKFAWRPVVNHVDYQTVDMKEFMQLEYPNPKHVPTHAFTGKALKNLICIKYDDNSMKKYPEDPNQSIIEATNGRLPLLFRWHGPVFAECGVACLQSRDIASVLDMDTRTFADVVAYLISAYNDSPDQKARKQVKGKILAVRANCEEEQRVNGAAPFVQVEVPTFHTIFDSGKTVSKISAKVGMPLLFRKYGDGKKYEKVGNQAITFMHRECDPRGVFDPSKGKKGFGWAPDYWSEEVGSVLVVNKDRTPLEVDTIAAFAAYCQFHMGTYFGWAGENEAEFGDGSYKKGAVNEITPQKWAKYLKQWNDEKAKRACRGKGDGENVDKLTLEIGRMALTAREKTKLVNRLWSFTDTMPEIIMSESDELVGAVLEDDADKTH